MVGRSLPITTPCPWIAARTPKTNQSYPELRAVVIIPVVNYGAVCLDQKLRGGIITKEKVDRLMQLAVQVVQQQQTEISEAELSNRYKQLPSH